MKTRKRSRKHRANLFRRSSGPRTADDFFALPEQFQSDWEKSVHVLSKMRADGLSLKKAAKQEGVAPRTVTRLAGRALKKQRNRSYTVTKTDSLLRVMMIPTSDGMQEISLRDSRQASTLGRYSDAVQKYIRTGDASDVTKFRRKTVTDASGARVPLITDLQELDRLGSAGVLSFESVYARSA